MMRRRIPEPTAPRGTLLWGLQQAHRATVQMGCSSTVNMRRRCLDMAKAHAAELERVRIPEGLCDYLSVAEQPWDVLWGWIERAGLAPARCS